MMPWLENRAKIYKSKEDMQALLETYSDLAKQDGRPDVQAQVQHALELLSRTQSVECFIEMARENGL